MVVALLYEMQSPCNCFTLSLSGSDSHRSNSSRDDNDATMEIMLGNVVIIQKNHCGFDALIRTVLAKPVAAT